MTKLYARTVSVSAGLILALVLGACYFGRPTDTKYYVIDYIPSPTKERLAKGPYPFVLRIRDCSIAEAYRRSQIVYRQSANQMEFYGYHLWAVDPDRMIGDLAIKHLKAARLYENVTRTVENYPPDVYLGCDIQAIEEYDNKNEWYAHLALEYQLEDAKTNQILWKKTFDLRKQVAVHEPVYVIRELSVILETINDRLTQEMEVILDEMKYKSSVATQDSIKSRDVMAGGIAPSASTSPIDTLVPAEPIVPLQKVKPKAKH